MNHIRICHINYYILFRHQSGRRQSYEFESAVKRLVRMSRIFFVSAILGHFHFFRGGVGWGGSRRNAGAAPQRRQRARGPAPAPCRYLCIYVCMYLCMYLLYYYILYHIIIYYIILYHILYHILYIISFRVPIIPIPC